MGFAATIQLCTYNRAHLLGRVLDACFEQTAAPDAYEVVLVNDGSKDDTSTVIAAAGARATCSFTAIEQPNAGLARARNAGIARATGRRIIFIDDDVLPTPAFVAEHLRSDAAHPDAVVRGAVIDTQSFDRLPTPTWTLANYSGNWFWTSNVSVPLATLRDVGNFTEAFREYGWEDIELGMRLRARGVRGVFNRFAVVKRARPCSCARFTITGASCSRRATIRCAAHCIAPRVRSARSNGSNVPSVHVTSIVRSPRARSPRRGRFRARRTTRNSNARGAVSRPEHRLVAPGSRRGSDPFHAGDRLGTALVAGRARDDRVQFV
jgi:glycosyltransferase involved in cell wall biosynthesis